jgi:hypothetical protein
MKSVLPDREQFKHPKMYRSTLLFSVEQHFGFILATISKPATLLAVEGE